VLQKQVPQKAAASRLRKKETHPSKENRYKLYTKERPAFNAGLSLLCKNFFNG